MNDESQPPPIHSSLARTVSPVSMNRCAMISTNTGTVNRWKCETSRSLR